MKIIYKTFILKKNIIRHLIISILVLTSVFLMLNIKTTTSKIVFDRLNIPENKTITITLEDNVSIDDIKNISYVKSVVENGKTYIIEFNNYTDVENFKEDYQDYFSNITINYVSDDDIKIIEITGFILSIVVITASIILLILTILNIIEVTLEEKNELALYKLLGYKNKKICIILLNSLISVYSLIFIISLIFNLLLCLLINLIISFTSIKFNIVFFDNMYYVILYAILLVIILITNSITYILIKKITPLKLKNISNY